MRDEFDEFEEGIEEEAMDSELIAVVGMACRFPGAANVAEFWENLKQGKETISQFSDEELADWPSDVLDNPSYVRAGGVLDEIDQFDAGLFGLTPREADAADPQQRIFFECSWEALEQAGYLGNRNKSVGVFAGCGTNGYFDALRTNPDFASGDPMQIEVSTNKDHLAPRLSYLLDLRGPSVPIQTACSTSLVAVHLAAQCLINQECDVALAGGVSIPIPHKGGYMYTQGSILSPDGHCRAFDRDAQGTVPGSGAGVVVLRRLDDALEDGDQVLAVIRGTAINNDGNAKVGYTAPSVEGQRRVIREAMLMAEVDPDQITYIEAHGTGTELGDPIEIEALRQAFGEDAGKGYCAIGSVKTNLGHCNSAAGVAGFIKAVLCLQHRTLVPSLHFTEPNPKLGIENSPFFVNTETRAWEGEELFAGCSSFGIGGTNAHVVLSQAPEREEPSEAETRNRLFAVSGRGSDVVKAYGAKLSEAVGQLADAELPDVAFTLNNGRRALDMRACAVGATSEDVAASLSRLKPRRVVGDNPSVALVFPGHGTDYVDYGRDLYAREEIFRQELDNCSELLEKHLGLKLAEVILDPSRADELQRPSLLQPTLFATSYATAKLWMAYGVKPAALMGHSIGEYVAAALAGVLSLQDALHLVAVRGRGTEELTRGAMVAVVTSEDKIEPYLSETVWLAGVNGPKLCVLSGGVADIEQVTERVKRDGLHTIALHSSHGFHSHLVEPLMATLTGVASGFQLSAPQTPVVSNLSGVAMTPEQATDPSYWAKHLRGTVRFNDCVEHLVGEDPDFVFLECGPGKVLSRLISRHESVGDRTTHSFDEGGQKEFLQNAGIIWSMGVSLDLDALGGGSRIVPLPAYPFDHKRYWVEAGAMPMAGAMGSSGRLPDHQWFNQPFTRQIARSRKANPLEGLAEGQAWLVFRDEEGPDSELITRLKALGQQVIQVHDGHTYSGEAGDDLFTIDAGQPDHYRQLMGALKQADRLPSFILHSWCWNDQDAEAEPEHVIRRGFDSVMRLVLAASFQDLQDKMTLVLLANQMLQAHEDHPLLPVKGTLLGAARVVNLEHANFHVRCVDPGDAPIVDRLIEVMLPECEHDEVSFSGRTAWSRGHEATPWKGEDRPAFKQGGTYVISNALRDPAFGLAAHLLEHYNANVILIDRMFLPPREEWDAWLRDQDGGDMVSLNITRIRDLEAAHGKIELYSLNQGEASVVAPLLEKVRAAHGKIDGLFHIYSEGDTGLILMRPSSSPSSLLRAKVRDALTLTSFAHDADLVVLFSENEGEYGIGQIEQSAYYAFLDTLGRELTRQRNGGVHVIHWGPRGWQNPGDDASLMPAALAEQLESKRVNFGMTPEDFVRVIERLVHMGAPVSMVSTMDYDVVVGQQLSFEALQDQMRLQGSKSGTLHERPELSMAYEAPEDEAELKLAAIWQAEFGIEKVGVHDDFFELGGHSLLAVQMVERINKAFDSSLTPPELFDLPTIAVLAAHLAGSEDEEESEEDLAALLAEIEGLSEDELRDALASEGEEDEA